MKTVTLGWLLRKTPTPSLAYSSNKYQYYYCPVLENRCTDEDKMVKIKKAYVVKYLKEKYPPAE